MKLQSILFIVCMYQTAVIFPAESKGVPQDFEGIRKMLAPQVLNGGHPEVKQRFDAIAQKLKTPGAKISPKELVFEMVPYGDTPGDSWKIMYEQKNAELVSNVWFGHEFSHQRDLPMFIAPHKDVIFAKSDLDACSRFLACSCQCKCKEYCRKKEPVVFASLCKTFHYRLLEDENFEGYHTLERSYHLDPARIKLDKE